MIFDSHAHYDDSAFDADRDFLLSSMNDNNIMNIVNVSSNYSSIFSTIEICDKYNYIYGALGIHPSDCGDLSEKEFNEIEKLLNHPKIVSVGEIGLDYHYDTPFPDIQKKWFAYQLNMAKNNKLPVIIHSRDAAKDTYDIMIAEKANEIGGVIHCYSYSVEMARDYLNLGYYIGIGGVVTFKNAHKLIDVVKYIPLDRIVIETDSPYLSPTPFRGERNSSLNLPLVIQKIAEIKDLTVEKVESTVFENTLNLYNIKGKICQN